MQKSRSKWYSLLHFIYLYKIHKEYLPYILEKIDLLSRKEYNWECNISFFIL